MNMNEDKEPRNVRLATLIKMCGKPIENTKVSNEEYAKADEEERILTIWDNGSGSVGGHRRWDISSRWVLPIVPTEPIGKVTGLSKLWEDI